jgi:hypothetical protein
MTKFANKNQKASSKREMLENQPQRSNKKDHRPLDFLTKVSTRSDKGEENNKLTLA